MKRLVFVVTGVLLAMVITSVGCATKALSAPAAEVPTQNITGELKYLSVPLEDGNVALTIETPQGLKQTVLITSNTTFILDGKSCLLEDVGKVVGAANESYVCTIVFNDECAPGVAASVYVTKKAG